MFSLYPDVFPCSSWSSSCTLGRIIPPRPGSTVWSTLPPCSVVRPQHTAVSECRLTLKLNQIWQFKNYFFLLGIPFDCFVKEGTQCFLKSVSIFLVFSFLFLSCTPALTYWKKKITFSYFSFTNCISMQIQMQITKWNVMGKHFC